jgi:hypothetical protein
MKRRTFHCALATASALPAIAVHGKTADARGARQRGVC